MLGPVPSAGAFGLGVCADDEGPADDDVFFAKKDASEGCVPLDCGAMCVGREVARARQSCLSLNVSKHYN